MAEKMNVAQLTSVRPVEIETYHQTTYGRISPLKTLGGKGKTVLVTAGATGIGLSIARSFAESGAHHIVLIQRRQEILDKAKQEIETTYPSTKVSVYAASVTDTDQVTSILKEVGTIDILVHNAAVAHAALPSRDISTEDFRNTFDVNVISTFHIIKEFLALNTPGPKTVIYTSSAACQIVMPGQIGYGTSKTAANQLIQRFAEEYAGSNVIFQSFHPGIIWTEAASKVAPKDAFDWEDAKLPGDFAVWLASPEAEFLTGRFVWAQWDVDELAKLKDRLAADPRLLTTVTFV